MARRADETDQTGSVDQPGSLGEPQIVTDATMEIDVTRTQIEQTRADMSETLDAIKEKLNPQALMSQAKDTVTSVTSDAMQQAKDTVQEVVAGVTEQARSTIHDVAGDVVEQTKTTVHAVVTDVSDHAKETARGAVSGAVSGAVDEAKEAVGSAVHTAKEAVGGAVDTARGAVGGAVNTARGAGSTILDVIKQNPLPASLIGLGLGWLYLNSRNRQPQPARYEQMRYPYESGYDSGYQAGPSGGSSLGETGREAASRVGEVAGQVQEKAGQAVGKVQEKAGRAVGKVQETAGQAVDKVQETAGQVAGKVGDAVGTAKQTAGNVVGSVVDTAKGTGSSLIDMIQRNPLPAALTGLGAGWLLLGNRSQGQKPRQRQLEPWAQEFERRRLADQMGSEGGSQGAGGDGQARRVVNWLQRTLQENPLPLGGVVLGLGAATGLLVPGTEQEKRVMGETRDRLAEKAQQAAGDLKMKAQIVVEESLDTAKQEARNQGLLPNSPRSPRPPGDPGRGARAAGHVTRRGSGRPPVRPTVAWQEQAGVVVQRAPGEGTRAFQDRPRHLPNRPAGSGLPRQPHHPSYPRKSPPFLASVKPSVNSSRVSAGARHKLSSVYCCCSNIPNRTPPASGTSVAPSARAGRGAAPRPRPPAPPRRTPGPRGPATGPRTRRRTARPDFWPRTRGR